MFQEGNIQNPSITLSYISGNGAFYYNLKKRNFLAPSFKYSCSCRRTPYDFSSMFLQVFSFQHWVLLLFFGCFLFWFHVFISPTFFTLCCCTASAANLREFFYSHVYFTLHSFPTFDTTCFYQGFPGSQQLFVEGFRASHWGSKQVPCPSVCMNHTVFIKRYWSVGSIYVVRPYRTLYQPLPRFEPTI